MGEHRRRGGNPVQFVRLDGATIHYQVISAAPDRPRLVFSNSLGTDFRIWRDVIVRLAGEFSILCYDKRGHGLSDVGEPPYAIETHAADLAGLIELAGFGPAIVCGISVGGLVAQALYVARPDLVGGLVLCDTGHRIGTADAWNERIRRVEAGGIAAVADGILKGWFTEAFRAGPTFAGYRNMLVRQPVDGYLGTVATVRDADFTLLAPRIAVPAACLVGEADIPTPPALVEELAGLIPGASYHLIAGAAHLPPVERPDAVVEVIRALAARLGERHVRH
jgi:3-oxoadipate enol-lactonase